MLQYGGSHERVMRDYRDVIMLAKPGYIYVVRNGGKMGAGRQETGRKWREERGGKKGKKWREEEESRVVHLIFSPGWWVDTSPTYR
jgi:hypothetical protein